MFEGFKINRIYKRIELEELLKLKKIRESDNNWVRPDPDEIAMYSKGVDYDIKTVHNLKVTRDQSRALFIKNPFAHGIINILIAFILGKGFEFRPVSDSPETIKKELALWEEWKELNRWDLKAPEICRRDFRDGETFIHFPAEDNIPLIRFLEPEDIDSNDDNVGIEVDPDDVEKVIMYFYNPQRLPTGETVLLEEPARIEPEYMIHSKIGVDSNVKRGLPILTPVIDQLDKYSKWIDDRLVLNRIRATLGIIRKHDARSADITAFADSKNTKTKTDIMGDSYRSQRTYPGRIIDIKKGTDYELLALKINARDVSEDGRRILLSIASAVGLAEYMVSADSSNSSYASTMVAESPAVKTIQRWQGYYMKLFEAIYTKVMKRMGVEDPKVIVEAPIIIYRDSEKEAKRLEIEYLNEVISIKHWQRERNYDPEVIRKERSEEAFAGEVENDDFAGK